MLQRLIYSFLFTAVFALGIAISILFIKWVMTLDVHPNYILGPMFFFLVWALFFCGLRIKKKQ